MLNSRIGTDELFQKMLFGHIPGGDKKTLVAKAAKLEKTAPERFFKFPRGLRAEILADAILADADYFVINERVIYEAGIDGSVVFYRSQFVIRQMLNWLIPQNHCGYTSYCTGFQFFEP